VKLPGHDAIARQADEHLVTHRVRLPRKVVERPIRQVAKRLLLALAVLVATALIVYADHDGYNEQAKADRITANNLGTSKRDRRHRALAGKVRSVTFTAVHQVVDKAKHIVAEDLTRPFAPREKLGKNTNRRLAAWTKGVTAEAFDSVSERRGSALTLVNAAYTSQAAPCCRVLGRRKGDRLHCTRCGAVWQADHAAAINVLERDGDPDITLHTSHTRVKQLIQERADRRRTRLPVQDSSTLVRRAKNAIPAAALNE